MYKKLVVLQILVCIAFNVSAQDKPESEAHTYISEEGKFYLQKNQPVYLYLSNSADSSAVKYRIRSKKTPQFTNPMHFDTDGVNFLKIYGRSSDSIFNEPRDTTSYPVYADCREPETYGIFNTKITGYKDGLKIYPIGTKLSLLEYDAVSGTSKIYYSINQEAFREYTQAIEFKDTLMVNIQFFGVDHVGNSESIKELNFIIDK